MAPTLLRSPGLLAALTGARPRPLIRLGLGALALLAAVMTAVEPRPEALATLDEWLRDRFVRLAGSDAPEERITVVDISEASLAEIGPWPWPRTRLADLAEILLTHYRARIVALDMVLPEAGDEAGDARLASLAMHGPLALAQVFDYAAREPALTQGRLAQGEAPDLARPAATATGFIANHEGLRQARCVGNIGFTPDGDGVLRRLPVRTRYADADYPFFAAVVMACARSQTRQTSIGSSSHDLRWPAVAGEAGIWRLPWQRRWSGYTVIPAAQILAETAPAELLTGRYVLVGSSALGLTDRVATPLAPLTAGVLVHASALSALLDREEGRLPQPWPGWPLMLGWTCLSVLIGMLALSRLPAWKGIALLSALAVAWLGLAYAAVLRGSELPLTAPLVAYFVLLLTAVPYEWWLAQGEFRRIRETFSHYVAGPVLDELLRLPPSQTLKPTLREVTVLIADMEGYTPAISALSLDEAARLTKDFLDCLTRPVLEEGGTLDKYTGDGLVAFWGAPLACEDHADRAVTAGMRILAEVDALNARRGQAGFRPVRVRIGIESGIALVGDLGTPFRSAYTAVGDCINFASKLQEAARGLPVRLLIGPGTQARVRRHCLRPLHKAVLRGTQTEVDLYTAEPES